jgi:hypothetical protein
VLFDAARSFNKWIEPVSVTTGRPTPSTAASEGDRPGDDFERRASWRDILTPHGWVCVGRSGKEEYWRRPGKSEGSSATVNYADSGLLYVFSTNAAPFEDGKAYSKFAAYTCLNHGGDYTASSRALRALGYGGHGRKDGAVSGSASGARVYRL